MRSSVDPHSWSPSPSGIRAARQCQPGACCCLCCPLGACPLVLASELWKQKCPEMSPRFAVLFSYVYPAQCDVFISLAVPAKQFVRWLTWLMMHKLQKFSLSLILKQNKLGKLSCQGRSAPQCVLLVVVQGENLISGEQGRDPCQVPWVLMPQPSGASFMESQSQCSCWEFSFRCILSGNGAPRNLSAFKMCSVGTAETYFQGQKNSQQCYEQVTCPCRAFLCWAQPWTAEVADTDEGIAQTYEEALSFCAWP